VWRVGRRWRICLRGCGLFATTPVSLVYHSFTTLVHRPRRLFKQPPQHPPTRTSSTGTDLAARSRPPALWPIRRRLSVSTPTQPRSPKLKSTPPCSLTQPAALRPKRVFFPLGLKSNPRPPSTQTLWKGEAQIRTLRKRDADCHRTQVRQD
jgi:hypothetical protein